MWSTWRSTSAQSALMVSIFEYSDETHTVTWVCRIWVNKRIVNRMRPIGIYNGRCRITLRHQHNHKSNVKRCAIHLNKTDVVQPYVHNCKWDSQAITSFHFYKSKILTEHSNSKQTDKKKKKKRYFSILLQSKSIEILNLKKEAAKLLTSIEIIQAKKKNV